MKSLEQLQFEARKRRMGVNLFSMIQARHDAMAIGKLRTDYQEQKKIDGIIAREKLADDFKEVLEMAGLSLVYLKRYKPAKEKPFKAKLFIEQVPEPAFIPIKKPRKRLVKEKLKIIKEFKEIFEGLLAFKNGFTYHPEKMKEPIYSKRKTFSDEPIQTPKKVKAVKPKYDSEKIKQFIESKREAPPKVIIRDSQPQDSYFIEKKPFVRPPAKYSNRNAIDLYVD